MFTVYILLSKKIPRTYVGYTEKLEQRIRSHNSGKVKATEKFRPWKILYIEKVVSKFEAKKREKYWKSGAGRRNLKKIFTGSRPTFIKKLGEARSNQ